MDPRDRPVDVAALEAVTSVLEDMAEVYGASARQIAEEILKALKDVYLECDQELTKRVQQDREIAARI